MQRIPQGNRINENNRHRGTEAQSFFRIYAEKEVMLGRFGETSANIQAIYVGITAGRVDTDRRHCPPFTQCPDPSFRTICRKPCFPSVPRCLFFNKPRRSCDEKAYYFV